MKNIFFFFLLALGATQLTQAQCFLNLSVTPNEVCAGQPATLVVTSPEGIPLQGGVGYFFTWSDGATTPARVVTPSVSTAYSVTVTHTSGCASSMERTVVVKPASFLNLSVTPSEICAGESAALTMRDNLGNPLPAGGGWTYEWSNGATTPAITVSPSVTTTYTVTVTEPAGCVQVMPSRTVVVNPKPAISANALIGVGQAALLATTDDLNNCSWIVWSNGDWGQWSTVTQPGYYTVTVTNDHGCSNTTSVVVDNLQPCPPTTVDTVVVVEIVEIPVYIDTCVGNGGNGPCDGLFDFLYTEDKTICPGHSAGLFVAIPNIGDVQSIDWFPHGGAKLNQGQSYLFSPQVTTIFTVVVRFKNGCATTKQIKIEVVDCLVSGDEPLSELAVTVYPNPATDRVFIELPSSEYQVSLMDASGAMVYQVFSVGNLEIPTDKLPLGQYLLRIIGGGKRYTSPLAIVR